MPILSPSFKMPKIGRGSLGANERLFFIHMFKAAGTTVHDALAKNFSADEICPERYGQHEMWPHEALSNYRFFSAHANMNAVSYVPSPLKVITILREPKARLLSHYEFLASFPIEEIKSLHLSASWYPKLKGLRAWLSDEYPAIKSQFWNLQTIALAGSPMFSPSGICWRDDEEILDTALLHFDNLSAFGLTEYLDESIDHICKQLDIGNFYRGEVLNKTSKEYTAVDVEIENDGNDEIIELIDKATQLDQRLYTYAKAKFRSKNPGGARVFKDFFSLDGVPRHAYSGKYFHVDGIGLALYGPYVRLSPGSYKLMFTVYVEEIHFDRNSAGNFLRVDVSRSGNDVLIFGTSTLSKSSAMVGQQQIIDVCFSIRSIESRIEFRLFVEAPCRLRAYSSVSLVEL